MRRALAASGPMQRSIRYAAGAVLVLILGACNSGTPKAASADSAACSALRTMVSAGSSVTPDQVQTWQNDSAGATDSILRTDATEAQHYADESDSNDYDGAITGMGIRCTALGY